MLKRNFLELKLNSEVSHDGEGMIKFVNLFNKEEFNSALQFIHYAVLPPKTSIGLHTHGDDEEVYIILEGTGVMEVDGEKANVGKGDTIINKPFGTHALYNTSESELKILVFEVKNG